jgi:hypothetical protein
VRVDCSPVGFRLQADWASRNNGEQRSNQSEGRRNESEFGDVVKTNADNMSN